MVFLASISVTQKCKVGCHIGTFINWDTFKGCTPFGLTSALRHFSKLFKSALSYLKF